MKRLSELIRVDCRFSALCELRALRSAARISRKLGEKRMSRAERREFILARYGW